MSNLTLTRPFSNFSLFDSLFDSPLVGYAFDDLTGELSEDRENITYHFDLPGVAKKDVQVTVERGTLKVRAKRKHPLRDYHYSVYLGEIWDPETVDAELKDGLLFVKLGKRASAKARQIEVR